MSEERELYDVRPYFESPHKDDAPPKWPQVAKSRESWMKEEKLSLPAFGV